MLISGFATHEEPTMSNPKDAAGAPDPRRFKLIPIENYTPEQSKLYDAIRSGARAKLANFSGSKPGMSSSRPTVMLPPCFWALTGAAESATPNPATRNIRASALERIAAFIDVPSAVSSVRHSGS